MSARITLAAALLAALALPAEARQPETRAEQAKRVERQADALSRANPRMDPGNVRFYGGSPWTQDWVLEMCRGPAPRPRASTCRAAADARRYDNR